MLDRPVIMFHLWFYNDMLVLAMIPDLNVWFKNNVFRRPEGTVQLTARYNPETN